MPADSRANAVAVLVALALAYVVAAGTPASLPVHIEGDVAVNNATAGFVCACVDWWPNDKCDYGNCSWAHSSVLTVDLQAERLRLAARTLAQAAGRPGGLRLRVGGTLADHIVYDVGNPPVCEPIRKTGEGHQDFEGGCLPMARWAELADFCTDVGCDLVFGLNALYGRNETGAWNCTNTEAFLAHIVRTTPDARLWGVELGNEVGGSHGILAQLDAASYAADFVALRRMVDRLWEGAAAPRRPRIVGPDILFSASWVRDFLAQARGALDVVTYHLYLQDGVKPSLVTDLTNPAFLDSAVRGAAQGMRDAVAAGAAGAQLWMGEGGGAWNSGQRGVTDAFASGFWYLHQLGSMAALGHQGHCRQTLVGGNYGLLDAATLLPNPDFFSAYLFKRLMGERVLSVTLDAAAPAASFVRAYAHCASPRAQRSAFGAEAAGSVTLLVLNFHNASAVQLDLRGVSVTLPRAEYHMTAPSLGSKEAYVNDHLLTLAAVEGDGGLRPRLEAPDAPLVVAPHSIAFVVLRSVGAAACGAP